MQCSGVFTGVKACRQAFVCKTDDLSCFIYLCPGRGTAVFLDNLRQVKALTPDCLAVSKFKLLSKSPIGRSKVGKSLQVSGWSWELGVHDKYITMVDKG